MAPETYKFSPKEQAAFDRVFPPEEVREFEEDGIEDWIGIFDALAAFDFKIKPEGHPAVKEMFLKHKLASQITRQETENGLLVYRRNITPLLRASLDVFWSASEYWTDATKNVFNQIFTKKTDVVSNAERDWQK